MYVYVRNDLIEHIVSYLDQRLNVYLNGMA